MPSFPTPGPLRLDLRVPAGTIDVETSESGDTEVELEPLSDDEETRAAVEEARIELREAAGGGHELVVEVAERRWFLARSPEVALHVRCPHGPELEFTTRPADVRAQGRLRSVAGRSVSGDLALPDVEGAAEVKTTSGDVRLDCVGGTCRLQTVSGDIFVGRMLGPATATLVSGDLAVREAASSVSASSVSGDQRLEAVAEGAVTLKSVSGDVLVGVRRGSRVWVDARALSGSTESELDLTDEPGEEGPLVELRVNTVSGDVRLIRAPAAAVAAER